MKFGEYFEYDILYGIWKEMLLFASPTFIFFGPVAITPVGHSVLGWFS